MASNPYIVILPCLLITGLSSLGLLNFQSEADGWKLFLPEGTHHSIVQDWREKHFVEDTRASITLFNHEENVLTSEALLLLLDLHRKVRDVEFEGKKYNQVCMKLPITNIRLAGKKRRRRRSSLSPHVRERYFGQEEENTVAPNPGDSADNQEFEDYFNFYGTGQGERDDYVDPKLTGQKKESQGADDDKLDGLPRGVYCDIVETLEDKCGEFSLLELWKYDEDVISKLSQQDIINAINTVDESPVLGYATNYTNYFGEAEYNTSGHLVRARSVRSIWLEQFSPQDIPPSQKLTGFEIDQADTFTLGYEDEVLKLLHKWREDRVEEGKGYSLNMYLGLSFNTEASGPIEYDIIRQICGYVVMFLYTMLTLGQLNIVEHKFYLAGAGILSVFFGYITAMGLSMALGCIYTPMNGILPFICLGIGIDDMFIIIRCLKNIPQKESEKNGLIKNVGLAMQHAGVSITITSLTDICAFGIGAFTAFPALRSFCISAAIAIAAIFVYQSSWFVGCLVIDQRRIQQKRDGFIPIIVHKDWEPQKWTQTDIGSIVMTKVGQVFDIRCLQALIIILATAMFGVGIWGAHKIKVEYNPITLIPESSYFRAFLEQKNTDFPSDGWGVTIYTQEILYTLEDFKKIDMIVKELDDLTREHNEWIHYGKELPKAVQAPFERSSGFWWMDLKKFIAKQKGIEDWKKVIRDGSFPLYLSDFLHNAEGSIYKNNFRFVDEVVCNMEAPPISSAKLGTLKFRDLKGPKEHLPAQHAISEILIKADLSNTTFAYSDIYPAWEIDEMLDSEMYRNLSLALISVVIILIITYADLSICILIFMCVLFTMVEVVGFSYYMGMTIDPFSLFSTIIGIGLSVDYAAHIGHTFIITKGTSKERAINSFITIGPAIVHGGITTFLALIFLAFSESHTFVTFFKIESMVILFGLFHGLFFLPVMMIFVGSDNVDSDEVKRSNLDDYCDKFTINNVKSAGSSVGEHKNERRNGGGPPAITCNGKDDLDFKECD